MSVARARNCCGESGEKERSVLAAAMIGYFGKVREISGSGEVKKKF